MNLPLPPQPVSMRRWRFANRFDLIGRHFFLGIALGSFPAAFIVCLGQWPV